MKKVFYGIPVVFVVLLLLAMIPIQNSTRDNIRKIKGLVTDIYLTGGSDIVVKLVDDENFYYIKRATEKGLDYNSIKESLLYQDVEIGYVNQWTLLNSGNVRSLYSLKKDGEIFFTTLQK